jgi:hypothetical protein
LLCGVKAAFPASQVLIAEKILFLIDIFSIFGIPTGPGPVAAPLLLVAMTSDDFSAAGFQPCQVPPPCWQREPGTFYMRMQAQGAAFVRYLAQAAPGSGLREEIEAFVGDWQHPWAYWYCCGGGVTPGQLQQRLG